MSLGNLKSVLLVHFYLWHWGDAGQWSWTRIVWHCILRRLRWQWSGGGGRGGDAGGDAGGGIDIGGESVASGRHTSQRLYFWLVACRRMHAIRMHTAYT